MSLTLFLVDTPDFSKWSFFLPFVLNFKESTFVICTSPKEIGNEFQARTSMWPGQFNGYSNYHLENCSLRNACMKLNFSSRNFQ